METIQGAMKTSAGTFNVTPFIDASTHTLQNIEYEHHEIHSGSHYFVAGFETLASSATANFALTTPNTGKEIHMTFGVQGSGQTEFYIYEGSTTAGGTAATAYNNNRNSTNSSALVSLVKNPTTNSTGTLIYSESSGIAATNPSRSNVNGAVSRDKEIILKNNETTVFTIKSAAAGNVVSYVGEWYEHTPKD